MKRRLLVVGASIAGVNAAEAARRAGCDEEIVVIDREPHAPYDRPPLSKQLASPSWDPLAFRLRSDDHWEAMRLELRLGTEVASLDRERDCVRTTSGETIEFAGLVIATGCEPKLLPFLSGLDRVMTLRTIDDAERLRRELTRGRRIVIVGAGFIGLEVASALARNGTAVTVVELEPQPLVRALGAHAARRVLDEHLRHGVRLLAGRVVVEGSCTNGTVCLTLENGKHLRADAVLVGIGVSPTLGWLVNSGVEVGDGVICDEFCQSSRPRVYAAGDIARWMNPAYGHPMRIEHWSTAREQGAIAGRNLAATLSGAAESRTAFRHVPYVWSDQYDLKIQIVGQIDDDSDLEIQEDGTRLVVTCSKDGAPAGGICINTPREAARLRQRLTASA